MALHDMAPLISYSQRNIRELFQSKIRQFSQLAHKTRQPDILPSHTCLPSLTSPNFLSLSLEASNSKYLFVSFSIEETEEKQFHQVGVRRSIVFISFTRAERFLYPVLEVLIISVRNVSKTIFFFYLSI